MSEASEAADATADATDHRLPDPRRTEILSDESITVECSKHYRGKTNGYVVDSTTVVAILDSSGRAVEAVWNPQWTEVAPGIETRWDGTTRQWSVGSRRSELVQTMNVRIHRHACPAHLQFSDTLEYTDYDSWAHSTSETSTYWVRYEA